MSARSATPCRDAVREASACIGVTQGRVEIAFPPADVGPAADALRAVGATLTHPVGRVSCELRVKGGVPIGSDM
ncbi:hypothetical protein GCM10023083_43920 [Streptomyces phyllanthi]